MKFTSAIALLATTVALTALNGVQVRADSCVVGMPEPHTDEEFVVIQYHPKATACLDVDDARGAITMADAYVNAYTKASGDCAQKGANCEIYFAEVVNHQKNYNHFLLRVASSCNAGTIFGGDKEQCGISLYHTDADAAATMDEDVCSCPRPTMKEVQFYFNVEVMIANAYCKVPVPVNEKFEIVPYVVAAQQLCALECADGTSDYSYTGKGVVPPCNEAEITRSPVDPDAHVNCKIWAGEGECEENPIYMLKNCATTCREIGVTRAPAWAPTDDSSGSDAEEEVPTATEVAAAVPTAAVAVPTAAVAVPTAAFLSPAQALDPTLVAGPTDDGGIPGNDDD